MPTTAALAPIASATLGLRKAHHGLLLVGMTLVIWGIETGVWMSTAAAVGFLMNPIEGLYMAGSPTHPGGAISGGGGYVASRVIAEDLGLEPWWEPVDIRKSLAEIGEPAGV